MQTQPLLTKDIASGEKLIDDLNSPERTRITAPISANEIALLRTSPRVRIVTSR